MAKETINEIVSQEAFDQIKKLSAELEGLNQQMNDNIANVDKFNRAMSGSASTKEAANNINNVNSASEKLNQTNSKRLEVERKIKEEGEKMAQQVKDTTDNYQKLSEVMAQYAKSQTKSAEEIVRLRKALDDNKQSIKKLSDEYKAGEKTEDNYVKEQAALIKSQELLKQQLSDEQKTLKQVIKQTKATESSYNDMSSRLTQLKSIWRDLTKEERDNANVGGVLKQEINKLDEALKGMDKSIGDNQRNVGNYEVGIESLISKLPGFGGMLGNVASKAVQSGQAFGVTMVTALKAVGKAMLTLMMNPLIALIAGLAAIIMGIVAAIKRNEDQVNRLKQAFAPLAGLLDITLKILGKVADVLIVIIENALKGFGTVMKLLEKIPIVGEKIKAINAEIEESTARANKIEQERQRIKKEDRQELVQIAKWERDISKLRNEAKQTEKFTDAQRIAKLEEAIRLETEILKIKLDDAIEQENLLKMEIASGNATTENLDALAQATADKYNAEKEFYDGTRRMETELNNMRREAAEELKRKEEERLAYIKSLNDEIKALELEHLSDIDKLQADMLDAQTWRDGELKKHPKQRAEIEQLYALKIDKLKNEYNEKEKARLIELEQAQLEHYEKLQKWASEAYNELRDIAKMKEEDALNDLIIEGTNNTEEARLQIKKDALAEEIQLHWQSRALLDGSETAEAKWLNEYKKLKAEEQRIDDEVTQNKIDNDNKQKESQKQLMLMRMQATQEMVGGFAALGSAIAQNIKDEKERMRVEAAIALVQALVNQGVAIAQVVMDEGDSYTKAARIIANVAAIAAAMVSATSAFRQAASAMPYAEGTDFHKGGDAIVGERYEPELVLMKNKPLIVDKPTFFKDMPIGTKVIPFSKMESGNNMLSMTETNDLLRAIKEKQTVSINVSDRVTSFINSKLGYTKILNSKFKA